MGNIFITSSPHRHEKEEKPTENEEDLEDGELHPIVSVTKIDPNEIPEVCKIVWRQNQCNNL